jgi:DNA-binding transcriptional ArsR family regulator
MLTNKQIIKIRNDFNGAVQRVIFKTLSDTNRYRIFNMLAEQPHLAVGDIAKALKVSIPLTSRQLKILEQGDMLQKAKQGQEVYYKLKVDNRIAQSFIPILKIR